MQTSRMRVLPGLLATALLCATALACGNASKDGTSEGKPVAQTPVPAADGKVDDVKAPTEDPVAAGVDAGGAAAGDDAAAGTTGGAEAGGPAAGSGTAGADQTGGSEEGGDTTGAAAPDPKALLKEIKRKQTKDDRATAAVAEAEAAGAEPSDVAKALNARGESLHAAPERAKVFFELALEKDPKYPVPAFNLAKQAAMLGELDEAKTWLAVVKERKGTKLLKQIDFDPMWEILKDDPDVRALLK